MPTAIASMRAWMLGVRRWQAALALTSASLLVYSAGLLAPYNLFALKLQPLLDIGQLAKSKPLAQAGFVATFAGLFGLYYALWRLCRGRQPRSVWAAVLGGLAAANVAMLWLYPIGAADLFDNIIRGRITAWHAGNPFYQTPLDFPKDPFFWYAAWRAFPSAYGPLWELMAAGASRLAGNGVLANVLTFKVLGLALYAGCSGVIVLILRQHAPERMLQGLCLFAWNPLVIYETAGNGHNDIVLVFFLLLGVYAWLRGHSTAAVAALTAGALVKFVTVLAVPLVIAAGASAQPPGRERWLFVMKGVGLSAGLCAMAYAPFWRGGDILSVERHATLFTTSLPATMQAILPQSWNGGFSAHGLVYSALALTATAVAGAAWWLTRFGDESGWALLQATMAVFLFYLLVTCLWFEPWYALWPLALAALLQEGTLARVGALLSTTGLWKTVFFSFVIYQYVPLPWPAWVETIAGPVVLGWVWLYTLYRVAGGLRRQRWTPTRLGAVVGRRHSSL